MPLHCSCIDVQIHAFNFLTQYHAYHRLSPKAPKLGRLTSYIQSITLHFVIFQISRYFHKFFSSFQAFYFSLFVHLFSELAHMFLCARLR